MAFELLKKRWRHEAEQLAGEAQRRQDALKCLRPVLDRFGIDRAYVFGSTCRGRATPGSDIDLYVEPGVGDSYWDFRRALEEAAGFPIDLHDPAEDDAFVAKVKQRGVCFYERQ